MPSVFSTRLFESICSPPKVNVMPQVTAKARKGGASNGSAQFDLGGSMPSARLPSFTAAENDLRSSPLSPTTKPGHCDPEDQQREHVMKTDVGCDFDFLRKV